MIFFPLTAYWIIEAKTPLQCLVPALLLAVRTCYVSKDLALSLRGTVPLLSLILIFTYWGAGFAAAVQMTLRVGLLIVLFSHIVKAPKSRILATLISLKPFSHVAYFAHYLDRITALLIKRYIDVQYVVGVRIGRGDMSLRQRASLFVRGQVSLVFEVLHIIDQVHLVLLSRGEVPATEKWKPLPPFGWTIAVGDGLCYAAVFLSGLSCAAIIPTTLRSLFIVAQ